MRNITTFNSSIKLSLIALLSLLTSKSLAEGTPQVSPNGGTGGAITSLLIAPDLLSGPYYGAGEDNRLKFNISDNVNENLYFGFDFRNYVVGATTRLTNVYWRVLDPSATVVASGNWNSVLGTPGSIDSYAQAANGPNIGGVTTGYSPLVFNPTTNGEFWMEIYRSSDGGLTPDILSTQRAHAPLFDLTVADNSGAFAKKNGRVYSDKWSLYAVSPASYGNLVVANSDPILYAYTTDQTIVRINFNSGYQPVAYNVAINKYGISSVQTWDVSRKSRNDATAPQLLGGYRIFLNVPDPLIFPVGAIPANPTFGTPPVSGCGPYSIKFNAPEQGDVKILIELNGTAGYQSGTSDRIIEVFDVVSGTNFVAWNGLNGLGVAVPSGTNVNMFLTFLKGRFNLPLHDAEVNKNGFSLSIVAPVPLANASVFWDDSTLINVDVAPCDNSPLGQTKNLTGTGVNNTLIETTTATAHSWSGDGNLAQLPIALQVGTNEDGLFQCDDFGNVRSINTWGWGYTSINTNLNIVMGCTDVAIVKSVDNATPNFNTNVVFTLSVSNLTASNATSVVVNDLLPNGYVYVSDDGLGNYNSSTGVWTIGTIAGNGTATLNITATVQPTGNYTNTATVSGNQQDALILNNTSTNTPTPVCGASVAPAFIKN